MYEQSSSLSWESTVSKVSCVPCWWRCISAPTLSHINLHFYTHSIKMGLSDTFSHPGNALLGWDIDERSMEESSCVLFAAHRCGGWSYRLFSDHDCFCVSISITWILTYMHYQWSNGKQYPGKQGGEQSSCTLWTCIPLWKESCSILGPFPAAWEHQHAHLLAVTSADNDLLYSHTGSCYTEDWGADSLKGEV